MANHNHRIRVTYKDERVLISEMTPIVRVLIEEKFGVVDDEQRWRSVYFSAWAGLKTSGQEYDEFDAWLPKIRQAEDIVSKLAPCPVCDKVGGCAFDDDEEPLFHVPPTAEEDAEPDPTRTAPSTGASSA